MNFYLDKAQKIKEKYVSYRRQFHMNPELGLEEFETSKTVKSHLEALNIPYRCIAGTGIAALIEGDVPGVCIALRADMDALPIEEQNDIPYASKAPGKMHACGHDSHTAMLMGAAELLQSNKQQLKGSVKLLFQPCEEGPSGARLMIKDGCLDEPKVDAVVALHVDGTQLPVDKMKGSIGTALSGLYEFSIRICGKGGHGAFPSRSVDPIVAAAQVITSLQSIVSRETDASKALVISIGTINSDGRWNVIPDAVELTGTVRTFDKEIYANVMGQIERVIAGICGAYRCTYVLKTDYALPVMFNYEALTEQMKKSAEKVIGEGNVNISAIPAMGGEDFACYGEHTKACLLVLGAANPDKGICNPPHSSKFNIDEDAIPLGMAVLAQTAQDTLEKYAEEGML